MAKWPNLPAPVTPFFPVILSLSAIPVQAGIQAHPPHPMQTLTLYGIPTCDSCRKARKWLDSHDVAYTFVNLKEQTPPQALLQTLFDTGAIAPEKCLNTAGARYRELGLKDRRATMSAADYAKLFATEGMVLKRPFVTDAAQATAGFKEAAFAAAWTG